MEFVEAMEKVKKICHAYNCCADCPLRSIVGGACTLRCIFGWDVEELEKIISEWQPYVDWSKVEVDTPILVWGGDGLKCKRHFAKYENDAVYAWTDGKTSYSATDADHVTKWQHAELAEV